MTIKISHPIVGEDEVKAVKEVVSTGIIARGPVTRRFEEEFGRYIGVKHAIATSNGTAALHAALRALDIKEGDEVITTPFSFISSSNSILYVGAKPVFADIDPKTYNIDPEKVIERIGSRTKALLIVHLYGQPCEMKVLREIASDYKLYLIEDASQAHGAEYKGKKVGGFGDIATFSFYATKNMTTGEGGMVLTNDDVLARKIRLFINHGQDRKYNHVILGYNYRITDIQAAVGIVQLGKLDLWNKKRIENASFYSEKFSGLDGVKPPYVSSHVKHVFHQYVIWVDEREDLMRYLDNNDIQTAVHYPMPIYKQPLYRELGYDEYHEYVEEAANHVLSIPVHPLLSKDQLNKIVDTIYEYYEGG